MPIPEGAGLPRGKGPKLLRHRPADGGLNRGGIRRTAQHAPRHHAPPLAVADIHRGNVKGGSLRNSAGGVSQNERGGPQGGYIALRAQGGNHQPVPAARALLLPNPVDGPPARVGVDFSLHVGADADMTNKISVRIDTMSTSGLGIRGLNVKDGSGASATYAIDAIAEAVSKVSAQRSLLGAVQNRLEHTINNLDNVVENTTAAESQIRDTDMATEMVKYSNNNILSQAGQSMLAQANQSNQGVLSLIG